MIGSRRERARHDDGRLDPGARQLAGVAHGEGIHRGLGGEVRSEKRGRSSARAAAGDPDDQTRSLRAEMRKRGAVDALGAEHIRVIQLGELFGREGFRRTEHHVAGVVHDHVQAPVLIDDLPDRCVRGLLRRDVQLDRANVHFVLGRVLPHLRDLRLVAAGGFAHARVDGVPRTGEGAGSQGAEAARRARDDDDVFHDLLPSQANPPLARKT